MLRRARLLFLVSLVAAVLIVATELPFSELVHARSASAAAAFELTKLRRENRALSTDVSQLKKGSTIEQLARRDYGLVAPGQRSYVVMPASTEAKPGKAAGALSDRPIPHSDLVPTDSVLSPSTGPTRGPESGQSFLRRLLNRLEFWKAVV